jgi:hypothetical protein
MTDNPATIGTALCDTGQRIDAWSRLLTGAALLACALPAPMNGWRYWLAGVLLAGIAQLYYALRTGFDRAVFAHWASLPEESFPAALTAFDQALVDAGLAKVCKDRSLSERLAGIRRLVQRQMLALAGQIIGTAGAVICLFAY